MKKYAFLVLMICRLTILFCNQTQAWNTNVWLLILWSGETLSGSTSSYFWQTGTWHTGSWNNTTGNTNTGNINNWGGGWWGGWGWAGVFWWLWTGSWSWTITLVPKNLIPSPLLPLPQIPTTWNQNSWAVITTPIMPITTQPDTYSPEIQGAYDYAKSVGITNRPSIQEARMFDPITRSEFAKMIVVVWKEINKREFVAKPRCEIGKYADVVTWSWEAPYISDVCNMGIMGWLNDKSAPITNFRPYDYITRAEIWTVLSRYLYWWQYNWDPTASYYEAHLKALQEGWIMKKIDEPIKNEIRWYVMLMLQRVLK